MHVLFLSTLFSVEWMWLCVVGWQQFLEFFKQTCFISFHKIDSYLLHSVRYRTFIILPPKNHSFFSESTFTFTWGQLIAYLFVSLPFLWPFQDHVLIGFQQLTKKSPIKTALFCLWKHPWIKSGWRRGWMKTRCRYFNRSVYNILSTHIGSEPKLKFLFNARGYMTVDWIELRSGYRLNSKV